MWFGRRSCLILQDRKGGRTAATDTDRRSNILVLVGTRPEAIKMFPIVLALQRSTWFAPVLITTGQHADLVRPILDLAEIDVDLAVAIRSDAQQSSGRDH